MQAFGERTVICTGWIEGQYGGRIDRLVDQSRDLDAKLSSMAPRIRQSQAAGQYRLKSAAC
jgi:hypothetical protein